MVTKLHGSAEVIRELRDYEKSLYREFGKKLTTSVKPVLTPIQNKINGQVTSKLKSISPNGMFHNGRSAWSGVNVSIKRSARPKDLVFIEGKGRKGKGEAYVQAGFEYAELAGIRRRPPRPISKGWGKTGVGYRSYIQNGQGDAFIRMLKNNFGKPGRFLWVRVLNRKKIIEAKVFNVAEDLNLRISRRLK